MDKKILQGILITVVVLGSGYLVYSFVVPTSDIPDVAEVVTHTPDTESEVVAINEIVDFESCVQITGRATSESYYYEYCDTQDGRFMKIIGSRTGEHLDTQRYELQTFYSPYPHNRTQRLIYRDLDTNEESIIIQNLEYALGLEEEEYYTLKEIAYLKDGSKMYFTGIIPESGAPPRNIYEFDTEKVEFRNLKISKYYSGYGTKAFSTDRTKVVVIAGELEEDENSQKLFLLDIERDTVETLVTLSGNETFDYCEPNQCIGEGYGGEISWVDDKTIEYAVYNMEIIETTEYSSKRAFIERRQVQIP